MTKAKTNTHATKAHSKEKSSNTQNKTQRSRKASSTARMKTPPFGPYPEWSTAKFWAFLRSGLRAKWQRWPPKYAVVAKSKRKYEGENKRQKFEYQCDK